MENRSGSSTPSPPSGPQDDQPEQRPLRVQELYQFTPTPLILPIRLGGPPSNIPETSRSFNNDSLKDSNPPDLNDYLVEEMSSLQITINIGQTTSEAENSREEAPTKQTKEEAKSPDRRIGTRETKRHRPADVRGREPAFDVKRMRLQQLNEVRQRSMYKLDGEQPLIPIVIPEGVVVPNCHEVKNGQKTKKKRRQHHRRN